MPLTFFMVLEVRELAASTALAYGHRSCVRNNTMMKGKGKMGTGSALVIVIARQLIISNANISIHVNDQTETGINILIGSQRPLLGPCPLPYRMQNRCRRGRW